MSSEGQIRASLRLQGWVSQRRGAFVTCARPTGPHSLFTLFLLRCREPRFMYASVHQLVVHTTAGVAPLAMSDVEGVNVAMDAEPISTFECSDGTYSWLHAALARTQANYITGECSPASHWPG